MDFRSKLKAYIDQRLSVSDLLVELDRAVADSSSNRELVRNQVEAFKRDIGLQQDVYDALRALEQR